MNRFWLLAVVLLAAVSMADQDQENVPLHVIGQEQHGRIRIYKTIHYGCEVFVAAALTGVGTVNSVALATGRCK